MGKSKKVQKEKKKKRILLRAERIWKLVHIEGFSYTEAWRKACPVSKAKKPNWGRLAKKDCQLFEATHGKDLQKILEVAGLGLSRVAEEISRSLTQKKVELYQGELVTDKYGKEIHFEDNAIQQRGRELLVRIHGLEKQQMEHKGDIHVAHELSGELKEMIRDILGENEKGRDEPAI